MSSIRLIAVLQAGLDLDRGEDQTGFPKSLGLFPVRFYALRPATATANDDFVKEIPIDCTVYTKTNRNIIPMSM